MLFMLDQSISGLLDDAAALDADELRDLIAAETLGKTRKGAIAGLTELLEAKEAEGVEAAPEPPSAPSGANAPPCTYCNTSEATTVHLGDGRKVAPGETVEVTPELARALANG